MSTDTRHWWSPVELATDSGCRWRLGPLDLSVLRRDGEWLTAFEHLPDDIADAVTWSVEPVDEIADAAPNAERFAAAASASEIRLTPRVAERSVVAFPRIPLHVLPHHDTRFYVSSPVWVHLAVGNPPETLCEVPTKRLSDTWFGPSTRVGDLAFALKTQARTRTEAIPAQIHRAVTPVEVRNRTEENLTIERFNLPVPYLSIFHDAGGALWTERVTFHHEEGTGMAKLAVRPGPPQEAPEGIRLSEPRLVADDNLIVRAFSKILRTIDLED